MHFERQVHIACPPGQVFAFLQEKHAFQQAPGSPVEVIEKLTDGPVEVGTRFREAVRMLPWYTDEIFSVVTRCEQPYFLEEVFRSRIMSGFLSYEFVPQGEGTRLIQRERLQFAGLLRLFEPLIKRMLLPRIELRLAAIKAILEASAEVGLAD